MDPQFWIFYTHHLQTFTVLGKANKFGGLVYNNQVKNLGVEHQKGRDPKPKIFHVQYLIQLFSRVLQYFWGW